MFDTMNMSIKILSIVFCLQIPFVSAQAQGLDLAAGLAELESLKDDFKSAESVIGGLSGQLNDNLGDGKVDETITDIGNMQNNLDLGRDWLALGYTVLIGMLVLSFAFAYCCYKGGCHGSCICALCRSGDADKTEVIHHSEKAPTGEVNIGDNQALIAKIAGAAASATMTAAGAQFAQVLAAQSAQEAAKAAANRPVPVQQKVPEPIIIEAGSPAAESDSSLTMLYVMFATLSILAVGVCLWGAYNESQRREAERNEATKQIAKKQRKEEV